MSWLKEVFDFSKENKDPFLKFLFRFAFLIFVIVLCFLAYDLITGRELFIGSQRFLVGERKGDNTETKTDTTSKIASPVKHDTAAKINSAYKPGSLSKIAKKRSSNSTIATVPRSKENAGKSHKVNTKVERFQIDRLRTKDLIQAYHIVYNYLGDNTGADIRLSYWEPDLNSISCSRQLCDYLILKGYTNVKLEADPSDSEVSGFWLSYDSGRFTNLTIFVGKMDEDRRVFRVMGKASY